MYCPECKKQIVDDAKFCCYCGRPVDDAHRSVPIELETCQIIAIWEKVKVNFLGQFDYRCYFFGDAIGSRGKFSAGRSSVYRIRGIYWNSDLLNPPNPPTGNTGEDRAKSARAHKELVDKLLADGWLHTKERGAHWWEYRFERKVPARE